MIGRILYKTIAFILFLCLTSVVFAQSAFKQQIPKILEEIYKREKELGLKPVIESPAENRGTATAFYSEIKVLPDLPPNPDGTPQRHPEVDPWGTPTYNVRTVFDSDAKTIIKRNKVGRPDDRMNFAESLKDYSQPLEKYLYTYLDKDYQIFEGPSESFIYSQYIDDKNTINLKEWIYAWEPNSKIGSKYTWQFSNLDMLRTMYVEKNPDDSISLYNYMHIDQVKANDRERKRHIIKTVRKVLPDKNKIKIRSEDPFATIPPIVYWTTEGIQKKAKYSVKDAHILNIAINEPKTSYPLLIDPTISYGQWIGGSGGYGTVRSLATEAGTDEIYAGGWAQDANFASGITFQGSAGGISEGFVIEIGDGASPTINWGQWLGGVGEDEVYTIAITGDEIYAGGTCFNTIGFEVVSFQGTYTTDNREGFVVEIADGASPAINWGQWLGSQVNTDNVYAIAVNGDEIYASGTTTMTWGWESATLFRGTFTGAFAVEDWIVELADGASPTINWGHWIGGSNAEVFGGIAVDGDEVYVAGGSIDSANWDTFAFQGGASGSEAFVVELADGGSPTMNWGQWLGGTGSETITTMAINPGSDEIYVGGWSDNSTSWETVTFQGVFSGSYEGFVVEIGDGASPTISWAQWLGGSTADYVYSIAVSADEIYAGGFVSSSTNFETVTMQGSIVSQEPFIVEFADGTSPTLNWGQWMGGSSLGGGTYGIAIDNDEIYAGGDDDSSIGWETVTFQGTISSLYTQGFVIEIADGSSPALNWGQYIGAGEFNPDQVRALAVDSDEIYAGGTAGATKNWEAFTFRGTLSLYTEGFVVEITDGASPSPSWGQWLGGIGTDFVNTVATEPGSNEIYAGGESTSSTSWDILTFQGAQSGSTEGFVVEIADGGSPTINWGQWLGGTSQDYPYTLAVTGDEIYVGGKGNNSTTWETISFQGTAVGAEGFVIEIADGASPTLAWGQWLGGSDTSWQEDVFAIAITGDELYAGGDSMNSTGWEPISWQGGHNGVTEGFVVEIADGGSPTINWGQWLGGSSTNYVTALGLTDDEIYAGGYTNSSTSWETVTFQGAMKSAEGFLVEIADGGSPALAWGQWLGGDSTDQLYALTVVGNEIYAGGYSTATTSWESTSFGGGMSNSNLTATEGWVVEISDGSNPTVNWARWLGGFGDDNVIALAATTDEIYVGGWSMNTYDWDSLTFSGDFSGGSEGFVIEIADDAATTSTTNAIFFGAEF